VIQNLGTAVQNRYKIMVAVLTFFGGKLGPVWRTRLLQPILSSQKLGSKAGAKELNLSWNLNPVGGSRVSPKIELGSFWAPAPGKELDHSRLPKRSTWKVGLRCWNSKTEDHNHYSSSRSQTKITKPKSLFSTDLKICFCKIFPWFRNWERKPLLQKNGTNSERVWSWPWEP